MKRRREQMLTIENKKPVAQAQLGQRIKRRLDRMSTRLRQVAEYVLLHYDHASFLPAAKLGQVVGVSESTVVRFATTLGYPGYSQFQEALQEIVRNHLTTVDRMELAGIPNTAKSLLASIVEADVENLRFTLRDLDESAFREAVSIIVKARRILIVGFRGPACLALFLGFNLNWIRGNVKVAGFNAQDLWEDLVHLGQDDLVIGISFPRYTGATVRAIAEARKRGCKIVALTDSVLSPLSKYADVVLNARHNIPAYVDSFVAALSIVNALLAAISMVNKARTTRGLRQLEDLWNRSGVFYRSSDRMDIANAPGGTARNRTTHSR
jgi:DNA-binding MurR/RpiR family transcriptional regulator